MSKESKRPTLLIRGPADVLDQIRRRAEAEGMSYSAYVIDRSLEGDIRGRRIRYVDPIALQHFERLSFELVASAKELRQLSKLLWTLAEGADPNGSARELEDSLRRCLKGVRRILRELWYKL